MSDIVKITNKGKATFKWFNKDGSSMYLIEYNDEQKQDLWTNSKNVINDQLEDVPDANNGNQLTLFE